MSTIVRRLITLPALFAATALLTVTIPVWLPLSAIAGLLLPAARSAPRVIGFITAFAWCEVVGVLTAAWIWLRHRAGGRADASERQRERWLAANYALQNWWCCALRRWAERCFRLSFSVEGEDALDGEAPIMLLRHCSIGDTMIPVVFYAAARGRRLRFVLKRELLFDPCLDIVGNRLPNYFADRSAQNTAREVDGVRALAQDLPAGTGVLIYPEGTRFTQAKRSSVLAGLERRGDEAVLERARHWPNLLPPKPGGALALLDAKAGRDLVFGAHTGFEGSASFARLFNGSWLDTQVRIRFWRVPEADVPRDEGAQRAFLYEQWDRMSREVDDLMAG